MYLYLIQPQDDRFYGVSIVAANDEKEANQIISEYRQKHPDFANAYNNVSEKDKMSQCPPSAQTGIIIKKIKKRF